MSYPRGRVCSVRFGQLGPYGVGMCCAVARARNDIIIIYLYNTDKLIDPLHTVSDIYRSTRRLETIHHNNDLCGVPQTNSRAED